MNGNLHVFFFTVLVLSLLNPVSNFEQNQLLLPNATGRRMICRSTLFVPDKKDRHYEALYNKIPKEDEVPLSDDELIKLYEEILDSVMCPIAQTTLLDKDNEVHDFVIADDGQMYLKSAIEEYFRRVPSNEVLRSPWTRDEMKSKTLQPLGINMIRLLCSVKQCLTCIRKARARRENEVELLSRKKAIFNPSIPLDMQPSVCGKIEHIMISRIRDALFQMDVHVYGGFVRRLLAVSMKNRSVHFDNDMIVDADAVIQSGCDVDIHMDETQLEEAISILNFHFDVKKQTPVRDYVRFQGGLIVNRLILRPKLNLSSLGIFPNVMVDIVAGNRLMIDFSVNALQYPIKNWSDVSITHSLLYGPTGGIRNAVEEMLVKRELLTTILEEINHRKCRMIMYTDVDFIMSLRTNRQEHVDDVMRMYYAQLLFRMRKMICDGWCITNLLTEVIVDENDDYCVCFKECGHRVRFDNRVEVMGNTILVECTTCDNSVYNFLDLECIREFVQV